MKISKKKNFSLIEILVVCALITIMISLTLPFIGKGSEKANVSRAQSQVSMIKAAIVQFETEYGSEHLKDKLITSNNAVDYSTLAGHLRATDSDDTVNKRAIVFLKKDIEKTFSSNDDTIYVLYDFDGDGQIDIPAKGLNENSTAESINATVAVYTEAPIGSIAEIKSW